MNVRNCLIGLAFITAPVLAAEPRPLARAALVHADGSPAGAVIIRLVPKGIMLEVEASGVAPGPHGLHLHETGRCNGPDFASAGGHLNPGHHEHGTMNPAGEHLGDLPNVTAGKDGKISAKIRSPMRPFKLVSSLLDDDGAAIVIHAGPDDYKTDPSGNSGARIACGVFERP